MRGFLLFCLAAVGAQALMLPRASNGTAPVTASVQAAVADPAYWFRDIQKRGTAAFNPNPAGYRVWRNVMDYGARGDGVTDDTDAINRAISEQGRCGPWVCDSSTTTPAVIYFPAGTYVISRPLIVYYMTMLHGNPNSLPVLKATPGLTGLAVIDASQYSNVNGEPGWISTNIFMRQIRNLIVDLTAVPPDRDAKGIHWPASQATSLQNVKVIMNQAANSKHTGIFVENGSAGHMADVETIGGYYGIEIGNQQYTMRNIRVSRAVIGIKQIWNWGWLYHGLTISDCGTAISVSNTDPQNGNQQVGSVVIVDSEINNCPTFIETNWSPNSAPTGAGQLILENIALTNVPVAIRGPGGATVLPGGNTRIAAWGQGNRYTPDGPQKYQGTFTPARRPAGLTAGDRYYVKSKPQYEQLPASSFYSVRTEGARGDGRSDDTAAVQNAIYRAALGGKVVFFDHGSYKVTNTIYVPPGTRMVGEAYSVILGSGAAGNFLDWRNPQPIVQIGRPGQSGSIEWSDMIVATQGRTPGAKVIEYNLNSARGSGLWDVHTRIGGAAGTDLQVGQCPIYTIKSECMVAHTNVHITKSASGVYMENNWFWTADHDLDDVANNSTRISIFAGRGMLAEGSNIMLWGNGVEHHTLYQYQFAGARDVFAGFIQTETPYMQPAPDAKSQPYPVDFGTYRDPDYNAACPPGKICNAYGLRILDAQGVHIYGAGLYSFFRNYDVSCSSERAPGGFRDCQNQIFSIEGSTSDVVIYTLSQVGVENMVTIDRVDKARWSDNLSVYSNTIGLFTYRV
ncbi:glycoside hydrolase family 55 protein [Sporormia fimetaria CBS 119925]|uniref:Glycoside hydrolase family 55 protein n=1 Tax=Sporormia fimetaria CBS 119925 TaxID=1340428 RepID=A0A6A6VE44_9PLEO|nr:glycoside hydrolase family 55 protein [Sporormia fimetaria CBS 119925]